MDDNNRDIRLKQKTLFKCDAASGHINFIYELTVKTKTDHDQLKHLMVAIDDLDFWWKSFSTNNDALLDSFFTWSIKCFLIGEPFGAIIPHINIILILYVMFCPYMFVDRFRIVLKSTKFINKHGRQISTT